jgi:carnitine O-acetyltransferase
MPTQVRIFSMPKSLGETLAGSPSSSVPRSVPKPQDRSPADSHSRSLNSDMAAGRDKPREGGITFAAQDDLPILPIPELDSTCKKYLTALRPLQGPREHAETRIAVQDFLNHDGPELQERLRNYAVGKTSYIEQFCTSLLATRSLTCG